MRSKRIGVLLVSLLLCTYHVLTPYNPRLKIVKPTENYAYTQMKQDLYALKRKYPKLMRICIYGYSREGRPLYAAVVGDPHARRAILIQGGIHAREHMTALLVMAQLELLLRQRFPRDICFHILPMTNPDGVTLSQTGAYSNNQLAMYERDKQAGYTTQTLEEYIREWKANAAGIDLNRNFDAMWERIHTHPWAGAINYRGPYPLSEPESKALAQYAQHRKFDATISYHATGSEIYYEFGNNEAINEAGLSLANALNLRLNYEIEPDSGNSFGGFKDWEIEKQSTPSLTIEVGTTPTPLPLQEFEDIWKKNRNVPYLAARWVLDGV